MTIIVNTEAAVIQWIAGSDTGTSSKTIWAVLMGVEPESYSEPSDPDDFGRCYRLLKIAPPHWRENLTLVSQRYPVWTALVREWDALTTMYERVIADGPNTWDKVASKAMYDRMKALIDEGRIAAGWKRTSPYSWEGPSQRVVSLGNGVTFKSGK